MPKLRLANNLEPDLLGSGHYRGGRDILDMKWARKQKFEFNLYGKEVLLYIEVDYGESLSGHDWEIILGRIKRDLTFKPETETSLKRQIDIILEDSCRLFVKGMDKSLLKFYKNFQVIAGKSIENARRVKNLEKEMKLSKKKAK